jgi:hypothetical protein
VSPGRGIWLRGILPLRPIPHAGPESQDEYEYACGQADGQRSRVEDEADDQHDDDDDNADNTSSVQLTSDASLPSHSVDATGILAGTDQDENLPGKVSATSGLSCD